MQAFACANLFLIFPDFYNHDYPPRSKIVGTRSAVCWGLYSTMAAFYKIILPILDLWYENFYCLHVPAPD